jgi:hypothetical protein
MGLPGLSTTRFAATLSILALIAVAISDFTFSGFWDENAMATSIVADVLVLIVGVAVVNEFLAARSRRQWQHLIDYALLELAGSCRHAWVTLAEAIGVAERTEVTRDELRALVWSAEGARRLEELALERASDTAWRRELEPTVRELNEAARRTLTSWAPVMVDTPYASWLNRYVELQAALARLELSLAEEAAGRRPTFEGTGDPRWIAARLCGLVDLGSRLALELGDRVDPELRPEARREEDPVPARGGR